jgi:archaeosine synthase
MFEVLSRDGVARFGKWKHDSQEISTPNLIFFQNERAKVPEEAGLILTKEKVPGKDTIDIPDFSSIEKEIGNENIVFVGADLESLDDVDKKELVVIDNCIVLLRDHKSFARFIVSLRDKVGYQALIYAPGISAPWNIALLIYCGIDLLDTSRIVLESRMGNFLTPIGRLRKDDDRMCFCKGCATGGEYESLLLHNHYAALRELELVRSYIRQRRLRELVELRAPVDAWSLGVLKHLDLRYYDFQEMHFPVGAQPDYILRAFTSLSLNRPDILRFRVRLSESYLKPPSTKVLLLTPCSAKKPYFLSKTHKLIQNVLFSVPNINLVHWVVVTSPLGLVPKELELFYPAQHYDIPVTGDWSGDEREMLRTVFEDYLGRNRYEHVIAHLGSEEEPVRQILGDIGIDAQFTAIEGNVRSNESLENLTSALKKVCEGHSTIPKQKRLFENMESAARFQFGELGEELVKGIEVKGRYPTLKLMKGDEQLGMLSAERGMISLTLAGAREIAKNEGYSVEIDDFPVQSTVFAVGVLAADEGIRIGDEVVVKHKDEVRGVGVAMMNPQEMIESTRGVAVKVRHHT